MTRETKVGIVVSCSFLCLIGAVLAIKMRGGNDTPPASVPGPVSGTEPTTNTTTNASPNTNSGVSPTVVTNTNTAPPPAPVPFEVVRSGAKMSVRKPEFLAAKTPTGDHDPAVKPSYFTPDIVGMKSAPVEMDPTTGLPKIAFNFSPPAPQPADTVEPKTTLPPVTFDPNRQVAINLGTNQDTSNPATEANAKTNPTTTSGPPVPPPPASDSNAPKPVPIALPVTHTGPNVADKNESKSGPPAPPPPAGNETIDIKTTTIAPKTAQPELNVGQTGTATQTNPWPDTKTPATTTITVPPLVSAVPNANTGSRTNLVPDTKVQVSPTITVPPLGSAVSNNTNTNTQTNAFPEPKAPVTPVVTVPPLNTGFTGTESNTGTKPVPNATQAPASVVGATSYNTNETANIRPVPQSTYATTGSTLTGNSGSTATSPTVVRETGLISTTPNTSLRNTMADPSLQQVTTPPLLASTVESRPLRTDAATVDMYDESEINSGAADSYAGLSQRFYGTAEYADALRLWNRDHRKSTAIVGADNKLRPGSKVFIPSSTMLEKRYPDALPNLKPVTRLVPEPTPVSGTVTAGFNAVATPSANASVITPVAAPAPPAPAVGPVYYKVTRPEPFYTVARTTLNDANRWMELVRLNPNFKSEQNLPVGTILVLPAGAKVPAENVQTVP